MRFRKRIKVFPGFYLNISKSGITSSIGGNGASVTIGKNGWEKIIDFKLNESEQAAFNKSAEAVRSMNEVLKTL